MCTVFAPVQRMRVRFVEVPRTLDGLHGQSFRRGESYELPLGLAGLLLLEGWAVAEHDESEDMVPTDGDLKPCPRWGCHGEAVFQQHTLRPGTGPPFVGEGRRPVRPAEYVPAWTCRACFYFEPLSDQ